MDTASSGRPAEAQDPSISPGAAAKGPITARRLISGDSGKTPVRLVMSTIARRAASRASSRRSAARCGCRRGRSAAIGIIEQAKPLLQLEHPPHAGVDRGHRYEAAFQRLRQALDVGAARHIDVDAGVEGERRSLDEVRRNAMIEEFRDSVVVADQDALEADDVP